MNLDIRNLTDQETFEVMIARLGGDAISERAQTRQTTRRALESALSGDTRSLFIAYADAVTEHEGAREDAATRAGLLLGVGVGVALNAYPDHDVPSIATLAADVVSGVIGAGVGPAVAQDIARQVLRALARVTDEPAAL